MRTCLLLALVLLGCTSPRTPSVATLRPAPTAAAATRSSKLTIVPQGMVGVALVGAEAAPFETLTADELVAMEKEVHAEASALGASGSPGIFFYAFDKTRLVYFHGRAHWRCAGLGCWDYVAEKMYDRSVSPRNGADA